MHLHGNGGLEEETSEMFTLFLETVWGTNPASCQVVCVNDLAIVKDSVRVNIFLYDIDFVDGATIGELARSVGKHSNIVRLLRYISHICYVCDINILFKKFIAAHRVILSSTEHQTWRVI